MQQEMDHLKLISFSQTTKYGLHCHILLHLHIVLVNRYGACVKVH